MSSLKNARPGNPVPFLRMAGITEGLSYLVLLGIAMPLKWIWGMPMAVKIVGWIHGVLFMVFCAALVRTYAVACWSAVRAIVVFIAAIVPFGPFLIDKRMRQWAEDFVPGQEP